MTRDPDAPVRARTPRLAADRVHLAYEHVEVAADLSLEIPDGAITAIVGPNACGKSTLLRALARLLAPRAGTVTLDGQAIHRMPTREVALRLGLLPQTPTAPDGISVADLVSRGRYPHQRWFQRFTSEDREAIAAAMAATGVVELADRPVDELSGGQRQRVWIAMALAQGTEIMLCDEPTTFLDLAHQIEVLDLLTDLHREEGRTIVLVLHDLNQAARYADHMVAMSDGRVVAHGPPAEIVTESLVEEVFGVVSRVVPDPVTATPMVIPLGRHANANADPTAVTQPGPDDRSGHDLATLPNG
jgi:iron complex transport system ATP-binding protein